MAHTEYTHAAAFDEYLNECFAAVVILGITFTAAQILKECDEPGYRVQYWEFVNYFCLDEAE